MNKTAIERATQPEGCEVAFVRECARRVIGAIIVHEDELRICTLETCGGAGDA